MRSGTTPQSWRPQFDSQRQRDQREGGEAGALAQLAHGVTRSWIKLFIVRAS